MRWLAFQRKRTRILTNSFNLSFQGKSNMGGYLGWWHTRALMRVLQYARATVDQLSSIPPPFMHLVTLQDEIWITWVHDLISWMCLRFLFLKEFMCDLHKLHSFEVCICTCYSMMHMAQGALSVIKNCCKNGCCFTGVPVLINRIFGFFFHSCLYSK